MSKTIPQLDPAVGISGSNKIELSQSDASSAESKYALLSDVVTAVVNPTAQISESQVTGLVADLASKLAISANLSDVSNVINSAINIGLQNGLVYVTSNQILTSPLPVNINIGVTVADQVIKLPDATTLNDNMLGRLIFINNYSSHSVSIIDADGNPINNTDNIVKASTNYFLRPNSNTTIGGDWNLFSLINSTTNQTIGGTKTFSNIIMGDISGVATNANAINTLQQTPFNAEFYPIFVASTTNGYQQARLDVDITINPSLNSITAATFNGALNGNASTVTTNANLTGPITSVGNATSITNASIDLTTKVTGTLSVSNGGIGIASGASGGVPYFNSASTIASSTVLSANQLMVGGGAGAAPAVVASLGTTTTVLHGNAAGAPTFSAVSLTADVSGTLPFNNGGFGFSSCTTGDIFYASGTNVPGKLAAAAAGAVLVTNGVGVTPGWSSTPSLTGIILPSATSLVLGPLSNNILTISSTAGAANTADLTLNRFDQTQGNNRVIYQTGAANQWSLGLRSGSSNYVIFDETNSVAQLTMTKGSGITGLSAFVGNVSASKLTLTTAATDTIQIANGAAISSKSSGAVVEIFCYPRFTDNKTYVDIGSAGLVMRQNAAGTTWMTVDNTGNTILSQGNLSLSVAGKTLSLKSGSNGSTGSTTLVAGTVTVATTAVTATDLIDVMVTTVGGVQGILSVPTASIVAGTSFVINSSSIADTSVIKWKRTAVS